MKSLVIPTALLASIGAFMIIGTVATTVPAAAKCMIDEGNGRRTPCDAMFIKGTTSNKPTKCFVDEGNGRRTPCDAMVKRKKTEKMG